MSTVPSLCSKDVAKILERMGYRLLRQRGSHRMYIKGKIGITLPMHSCDMRKGLLLKIIKQTEVELEDFLKFL